MVFQVAKGNLASSTLLKRCQAKILFAGEQTLLAIFEHSSSAV